MKTSTNRLLLALALAAGSMSASADHYDYTPAPAKPVMVAKAPQSSQAATMTEQTSDKPAEGKGKKVADAQFEQFWKEFTRLGG